jgi:putative copper resistance protein D
MSRRLVAISPRSFVLLWLVGLALAILFTWWLRAGNSASAGFIFLCAVDNVPPPRFPYALFTVALEPLAVFFLLSAAAAYLLLWLRVRASGRGRVFPVWRLASFMVGIGLVMLTVFGPLAAYDRVFLFIHMIQHFILITIAPPLILLGGPMTLLLMTVGARRRERWIYPVTHARVFQRFTNPVVGLAMFAAVPILWYTTPAFEIALENQFFHFGGYALFLFAGIHYWWPIVGGNPSHWNLSHPVRVGYLFALVPIHAFLGLLFYEPSRVLYEQLAMQPRYWGPDPLLDQQMAGAIMFIVGEAFGLTATIIAAAAWARADTREAKRRDAQIDRERERARARAATS